MNRLASSPNFAESVRNKITNAPFFAAVCYKFFKFYIDQSDRDSLYSGESLFAGWGVYLFYKNRQREPSPDIDPRPHPGEHMALSLASVAIGAAIGGLQEMAKGGNILRGALPGAAGAFFGFRATLAMDSATDFGQGSDEVGFSEPQQGPNPKYVLKD